MTLDLAKLRAETVALLDGTTPGPWREGQDGNSRVYGPDGMGALSGLVASFCRRADARLVTATPSLASDTLRLLDEIERLRDVLSPIVNHALFHDREYLSQELNEKLDAARAALAKGGPDDR